MVKYKVIMVCKEISRAEITIKSDDPDPEVIKDRAWALFDSQREKGKVVLEQVNSTKVEKA